MKMIRTPITDNIMSDIHRGDMVELSGRIYCGRDAVLPRICQLLKEGKWQEYGIDLQGGVIFHTAVSPAGVGPTSSNKLEIEESIPALSRAGVRVHLGKGTLHKETIDALEEYRSVFAVIPPVTALLREKTISQRCIAFPELGMEALYELEVEGYPIMIAAAHGESIYSYAQ